jgi:hypothetical protein
MLNERVTHTMGAKNLIVIQCHAMFTKTLLHDSFPQPIPIPDKSLTPLIYSSPLIMIVPDNADNRPL